MAVNVIITSVIDSRKGYRDDYFYVPALFYAADWLLLARSCSWAEDMIMLVIVAAGKWGLNTNKGPSNVLLYNCPERVGEIGVAIVLDTWGLIWVIVGSALVHIRGGDRFWQREWQIYRFLL